MNKPKKLLKEIYHSLYPGYLMALNKSVRGCETLLDVGCGAYSPVQYIQNKPHCTGVDAFLPSIEASRNKGFHDDYRQMNFAEIGEAFEENSFDCVLANDVIEHLKKEDGLKFMKDLERIAKKKVIIFTPNGFVPQEPFENNPWQVHRSGWSVDEMQKFGYKIRGINGWKSLRQGRCEISLNPKAFWLCVTYMLQLFTYFSPNHAFQIFCVKEFKNER